MLSPATIASYASSPNHSNTAYPRLVRVIFSRFGAQVNMASVLDGSSNTILIGEALPEQNGDMKTSGGWFRWNGGNSVGTTIIPINYQSNVDDGETSPCTDPQRSI